MPQLTPFKISIMKDLSVIDREVEITSFQELSDVITKYSWAPALFNGTRSIANAVETHLMVLDVDSGCDIIKALQDFEGHQHWMGPSRSHQKEKNGITCDRFRIVLWLEDPITNDATFKATWEILKERFTYIDPACKDISRFFYPCTSMYACVENELFGLVPVIKPPANPVKKKQVSNQEGLETFPDGARNHNMFKLACSFVREGITPAALEPVMQDINDLRCNPPLGKTELDVLINSALKYPMEPEEAKYEEQLDPEPSPELSITALDVLDKTFEYLLDDDKARGKSTGMASLDTIMGGGFRKGEVTVLLALEKTGKNALWEFLQVALLKEGISQGYASQEISPRKGAVPTYASIILGRNLWLAPPNSSEQDLIRTQLAKFPIHFTKSTGALSWEKSVEWMDSLREKNVENFWFDHLHYMLDDPDFNVAANRLKNLHLYADKHDVHINVIVQPNDLKGALRVTKDHIKGNSQLRQHLDTLITLNRVDKDNHISILKRELGRSKSIVGSDYVYIQYDPENMTFKHLPDYVEPEPEDGAGIQTPHGYFNRSARPPVSKAITSKTKQSIEQKSAKKH